MAMRSIGSVVAFIICAVRAREVSYILAPSMEPNVCLKSGRDNKPMINGNYPEGDTSSCTSFYKFGPDSGFSLRVQSPGNAQTLSYQYQQGWYSNAIAPDGQKYGPYQIFTDLYGKAFCTNVRGGAKCLWRLKEESPPTTTIEEYTGAPTTVTTTTTTTTTGEPAGWVQGRTGENCVATCLSLTGKECVEFQWPTIEAQFSQILGTLGETSCAGIDIGDWDVNPGQYADYGNICYWAYGTANSQEQEKGARCTKSDPGVARFCPCGGPVLSTTEPPTMTTISPPTTTTRAEATQRRRRRANKRRRRRQRKSGKSRRRRDGARRRRRNGATPSPTAF